MSSDAKDRMMVELIKASLENLSDDDLEKTADAVMREAQRRKRGATGK